MDTQYTCPAVYPSPYACAQPITLAGGMKPMVILKKKGVGGKSNVSDVAPSFPQNKAFEQ